MSRPILVDDESLIRTNGRTFVAILWTSIGLAFGFGMSYATMRGDVSSLRDGQERQGHMIDTISKDVKALGTKVDTVIGYQNGITGRIGNRFRLPVEPDPEPEKP